MNTVASSSGKVQSPPYQADTMNRFLYEKLSTNVFWAKLTRWEFWPFSILYFPILFYWIWLVLKTRSIFFFTSSNPGIQFGGMLGESKNEIFKKINSRYIPKTYKLKPDIDSGSFLERLQIEGLKFPIVLKPDIGERGWMVELIKNEHDLHTYLKKVKVDFLVQEYVSFPIELGVFYYRYPDRQRGTVSSIVTKQMLSVRGDGQSTVRELAKLDVRSKMQLEVLEDTEKEILNQVPGKNEEVELVSIGNHCRGTMFLNGNHLISDQLISVFDKISKEIEGFYFGRYDIRCASIEDLYKGKNFKILELNGAGAEPAHIYHPGYSLIQAYKDITHHLGVLADISKINHANGHRYMSFSNGLKEVSKIIKYNRQ